MFPNSLTERLGLSLPIIQAPMAGGPTTPELVAAVGNAGGLGSLGASFMSGKAIADACDKIKARSNKAYAVNLFVPEDHRPDAAALRRASAALDGYRAEVGLTPPPEKAPYLQPFEEQLQAVLAARPAVYSFCFGIPDDEVLDRLRDTGAYIIGTATTVAEAVLLEEAGVDAIVAQGFEAGGHRSTFTVPFDHAFTGLMALLPQIVDAVELPVIAAGGIMDGRGVAAALAMGAAAAQLGTAFLATEECGWGEVQRQALLASRDDSTAITDAFTGKPARGLRNRFMVEAFDKHLPKAPYPAQHGLSADLRRAAAEQGRADLMAIWAGQGVGAIRRAATADLMQRLRDELAQALTATSAAVASLNGRTSGRR
jgi:nitronate monooxygenase